MSEAAGSRFDITFPIEGPKNEILIPLFSINSVKDSHPFILLNPESTLWSFIGIVQVDRDISRMRAEHAKKVASGQQ